MTHLKNNLMATKHTKLELLIEKFHSIELMVKQTFPDDNIEDVDTRNT